MNANPFPSSAAAQATVQVHALSAGHFSLPEEQFVKPATPGARKTVPSLCFLIQHTSPLDGVTTRIVFDLGLRRDINRYSEPIRRHVATRHPLSTEPDVVASLKVGGLTPRDIDYIIYSHVHWDHVGEPRDFPTSTFVVGYGSLDVLHGKDTSLRGKHSFFEADLLDPARTIQLADGSADTSLTAETGPSTPSLDLSRPWRPFGELLSTLDLFGDGSLYIVDAPGHLPGHINLLARVSQLNWVYLAGDTCHDRRLLLGEKEIADWLDSEGQVCCIHTHRVKAEETIRRVKSLEDKGVEVIFAHDVEWEQNSVNAGRFLGATVTG